MLYKRLGQHFLRDTAVQHAIAGAIAPAAGQMILEIGPGDGALTQHLQKTGAHLTALEIDRRFAAQLRTRYQDNPRIHILHADALRVDWRQTVSAGARLAGNLPYNISTPLLLKMAANAGWLSDCHVMVQKEVGMRITASPGSKSYGRLSVALQLSFLPQHLFDVPASAFKPPPAVDSAVLRLLPAAPPPLPPHFDTLLIAAFGKRRKILKNALMAMQIDWQRCPLDGNRRAESLAPNEFLELARHVSVYNQKRYNCFLSR